MPCAPSCVADGSASRGYLLCSPSCAIFSPQPLRILGATLYRGFWRRRGSKKAQLLYAEAEESYVGGPLAATAHKLVGGSNGGQRGGVR